MALTLMSLTSARAADWAPAYVVGGGRFALASEQGSPSHVVLDADGTRLVAAMPGGSVRVRGLGDPSRDGEWATVDADHSGLAAASGVTAWLGPAAVAWRRPDGVEHRVVLPSPHGLALSADGGRLAVGSDGHVLVFNTHTAARTTRPAPPGLSGLGFVNDTLLVSSPAGLAQLGADGALHERALPLPGGGPIGLATGGSTWVAWRGGDGLVGRLGRSETAALPGCQHAAVSSSGRTLVSREPGALHVVSALKPATVLARLPGEDVAAFGVSADGGLVFTVRRDGVATLLDSRTGRVRGPADPAPHAMAIAWVGQRLWVGDRSGRVVAFEAARPVQSAAGVHRGSVTFLAALGVPGGAQTLEGSPQVLSAGLDRAVLEHSAAELSGTVSPARVLDRRFAGPRSGGRSVYFGAVSPNGQLAALVMGGGEVWVRALTAGAVAQVLTLQRAPLAAAIDDAGRVAVAGLKAALYVPSDGGYGASEPLPGSDVTAVAFWERAIVLGTSAGEVLRFDPSTRVLERATVGAGVRALRATPLGLALGLDDGSVLLLDAQLRVTQRAAKAVGGAILELAATADWLAARGADGRVAVWPLGARPSAAP
jgi:hypothetical protein